MPASVSYHPRSIGLHVSQHRHKRADGMDQSNMVDRTTQGSFEGALPRVGLAQDFSTLESVEKVLGDHQMKQYGCTIPAERK